MKKFVFLLAAVFLMSQKGPVPLPGFQVINLQNNSVINNASLKGKVVLFNFWTLDDKGKAQQDIWKKWGDDKAAPIVSEYVGAQSDTGSCEEIQAPPGKRVIGIHGMQIPKQLLTRLSLVFSQEETE